MENIDFSSIANKEEVDRALVYLEKIADTDIDESIELARKISGVSVLIDYGEGIAASNYHLGKSLGLKNQMSESKRVLQRCFDISETYDLLFWKQKSLSFMAYLSIELNELEEGVEYLSLVLELADKNEPILMMLTYMNLGEIFRKIFDYETSSEYFLSAIKLTENAEEFEEYRIVGFCNIMLNLLDEKIEAKEKSKGIENIEWYFNEIISSNDEKLNEYAINVKKSSIARYYHKFENYDKAKEYYDNCLRETVVKNKKLNISSFIIDALELYSDMENYEEFTRLVDNYSKNWLIDENYELCKKFFLLSAITYEKMGEIDKSFEKYKEYAQTEELFVEKNNRRRFQSVRMAVKLFDIKKQCNLLLSQNSTDELTDIGNRRAFNEEMKEIIERFKSSSDKKVVIVMFDLDYFKNYNDEFGHVSGDECLVSIGKLMKKYEKKYKCSVFRYGGDEFIITKITKKKILDRKPIEELKDSIENLGYGVMKEDGEFVKVTASIGVAEIHDKFDVNTKEITRIVDNVLYSAKALKRNSIKYISIK